MGKDEIKFEKVSREGVTTLISTELKEDESRQKLNKSII